MLSGKGSLVNRKSQYVSDFPLSQNAAQDHFIVENMHESRLMCGWSKNILGLVGIPLLGHLRHQAIYSTLQSSSSLGTGSLLRPSFQRQLYHPVWMSSSLPKGNRKNLHWRETALTFISLHWSHHSNSVTGSLKKKQKQKTTMYYS